MNGENSSISTLGHWSIWKRLRILDYCVVAVAIGTFAALLVFVIQLSGAASEVSIKADDQLYVYRLDKNQEIAVQGPLGTTEIEIKENAVRIVDSPCRDKICVHSGWLRNGGQWAACLPNKVFVNIKTGTADTLDASTY